MLDATDAILAALGITLMAALFFCRFRASAIRQSQYAACLEQLGLSRSAAWQYDRHSQELLRALPEALASGASEVFSELESLILRKLDEIDHAYSGGRERPQCMPELIDTLGRLRSALITINTAVASDMIESLRRSLEEPSAPPSFQLSER